MPYTLNQQIEYEIINEKYNRVVKSIQEGRVDLIRHEQLTKKEREENKKNLENSLKQLEGLIPIKEEVLEIQD